MKIKIELTDIEMVCVLHALEKLSILYDNKILDVYEYHLNIEHYKKYLDFIESISKKLVEARKKFNEDILDRMKKKREGIPK